MEKLIFRWSAVAVAAVLRFYNKLFESFSYRSQGKFAFSNWNLDNFFHVSQKELANIYEIRILLFACYLVGAWFYFLGGWIWTGGVFRVGVFFAEFLVWLVFWGSWGFLRGVDFLVLGGFFCGDGVGILF